MDLSSDMYKINQYVNEVQKSFTPGVGEDTLLLSTFGYQGAMFASTIQNSIVMASEFSNESIPTKARFEKNVIAHALGMGITDTNAIPAQMDALLMFMESDIESIWPERKKVGGEFDWNFTFDKDSKIYFGDIEFHIDYDILIKKVQVNTAGRSKKFAYTAKYIIDVDNPVSDVSNPYLSSPIKMNIQGMSVIITKCTLRQVEKSTIYKKVLSDNTITSKTVTFEFEGQLASFTIDVTEGATTTHMMPVYEGLVVENRKYPHFYYTYLDGNTIRIKFDRNSYMPRINSDVKINIQTTKGENGNFSWNSTSYPEFVFDSERCNYTNIACGIRPTTNESLYGTDKKSVDGLRAIIPKEALSRGSISNLADLENFFNMINTDSSKLYLYKKRDNALGRLYYSYILLRDKTDVIVPTNTIDVRVLPEDVIEEEGSGKLVFKRGQLIQLKPGAREGELYRPDTGDVLAADDPTTYDDSFVYIIPYTTIINTYPLYGMYLMTTVDESRMLDFTYINEACLYQYIATSIRWARYYLTDPDIYNLYVSVEKNIIGEREDIIIDPDTGEITKCPVRCIAVFYDEEDNPHRWGECTPVKYDEKANIISFHLKLSTSDYIDTNNKIRIDTGLYDIGTTDASYAHLRGNTKTIIHVLSKQDEEYGLNELEKIVPNLDGFSLSNSYTVMDGVNFFYDYSDIVNSTVTVEKDEIDKEKPHVFHIKDVPVLRHNYFANEDNVSDFCGELVKRKNYIDYAIRVLEDAFGMDFKFFNTYGPSELFTLDNATAYINRTNLTMTFRVKIKPNMDTSVIDLIRQDIKNYIEQIDTIESLHIPNLITEITTKYQDYLTFFEFIDMNGYGPGVQHLYTMPMPDSLRTPEFLNINTLPDNTPDINIVLA